MAWMVALLALPAAEYNNNKREIHAGGLKRGRLQEAFHYSVWTNGKFQRSMHARVPHEAGAVSIERI